MAEEPSPTPQEELEAFYHGPIAALTAEYVEITERLASVGNPGFPITTKSHADLEAWQLKSQVGLSFFSELLCQTRLKLERLLDEKAQRQASIGAVTEAASGEE
mmetsp:Transcript_15879/g.47181  ORF Transcript_15879/g.47181 Transcript_15879/m.47181 type:complete len:104 (-) Transcript_15879:253-564(-)